MERLLRENDELRGEIHNLEKLLSDIECSNAKTMGKIMKEKAELQKLIESLKNDRARSASYKGKLSSHPQSSNIRSNLSANRQQSESINGLNVEGNTNLLQDLKGLIQNLASDNHSLKTEIRDLKDTFNGSLKPLHSDVKVNNFISEVKGGMVDVNTQQATEVRLGATYGSNFNFQMTARLEEELAARCQQVLELQEKVRQYENINKRLVEERKGLLDIVKNMPKNPKDIDFEILEQKFINFERAQRLKELEIENALKKLGLVNRVDGLDALESKEQWEKERQRLHLIIENKNTQITRVKKEVEVLLTEFKKLKAQRTQ